MRRTTIGAGVARYRVSRPAWSAIGWTLVGRLALAVIGAVLLTVAIGQGWI